MKLVCPHCKKIIKKEDLLKNDMENLEKLFHEDLIKYKNQLQKKNDAKLQMLEKHKEEEMQNRFLQKIKAMENEKKQLKNELSALENIKKKEIELEKRKIEWAYHEKESKLIKQLENKKVDEKMLKTQLEKEYKKKQLEFQTSIKLLTEELEKKLEAKAKENEELNKKLSNIVRQQAAKHKSQELQGEEAENEIKNQMEKYFIYDEIIDIKKGQKGGDLVLKINEMGYACGSILIEVKNTKTFQQDWVKKLGDDLLINECDYGLIISKAIPKNLKGPFTSLIAYSSNIFSCSFDLGLTVLILLRQNLVEVYKNKKRNENINSEKDLLYQKVNSPEFQNRLHKIVTHFNEMKNAVDKQEQSQIKYLQIQRSNIRMVISEIIKIRETVNTALIPYKNNKQLK